MDGALNLFGLDPETSTELAMGGVFPHEPDTDEDKADLDASAAALEEAQAWLNTRPLYTGDAAALPLDRVVKRG